jgi:hypothetical protein
MVVVPVACFMGAVEAGLVVGVSTAKERDITWPAILMAVASATLLAAGVLRHYIDVYMHSTVRGISFIFVGIDALGDVFSLVSIVFQPTLDVLGMVIYGTELVLWIGIFMCGVHCNLIPWLISKRVEAEVVATVSADAGQDSTAATSGVALHQLPSSTSVFRTPSGELEVMRRSMNATSSGKGVPHVT